MRLDGRSELESKARAGDAGAQNTLGKFYLDECDVSYAVEDVSSAIELERAAHKWFELAAEQGHREAQYSLAVMDDVEYGDQAALRWCQAAAEQEHPGACMLLAGYIFRYTRGKEREGVKWYRRARELKHAHDANTLDIWRATGDFAPADHVVLEQLRKGAEGGDILAQLSLGEAYALGEVGCPEDFIQAYAWFAVAGNHVPGTVNWQTDSRYIRRLEHVFDEDELGQAHRLAAEYLEKYGRH